MLVYYAVKRLVGMWSSFMSYKFIISQTKLTTVTGLPNV